MSKRDQPWIRVTVILLMLAVVVGIMLLFLSTDSRAQFGYFAISATLGALVGASEVFSRYRDEPGIALMSVPGLLYCGLNAAIAAFAYGLLREYGQSLLPAAASDRLGASLVAGFGAMAVLRSKIVTIRTPAGEETSVGPDAVVSAVLAAADRGIDRTRAETRLDLVFAETTEVKKPDDAADFIQVSLAAFQNLSTDEVAELKEKIGEMNTNTDYSEELRLQAICYLLINTTGDKDFTKLMGNLKKHEESHGPAPSP